MKKLLSFMVALMATVSMFAEVTVTKTLDELVAEHSLAVSEGNNAICHKTLTLDEVVTISTSGENNCGAIYLNQEKHQWRLYQAKEGDITISVADGYSLKSIKLTYLTSNNGILVDGPATDVATEVSGASVTYEVGNSGDKTNGQVRITAFEVVYEAGATGLEDVELEADKARKVIENGQLIIIKDGVKYNIFGAAL